MSIKDVEKFLENKEARLLIIIGPSGSGKTSICNDTFKAHKNKYSVLYPEYNDFKQFEDSIDNFMNTNDILCMMENKKKVIFLDDAEDLFSQFRMAKTYCLDFLNKNHDVKMIIALPPAEEKRVNDIRNIDKVFIRLKGVDKKVEDVEQEYTDKSLYEIVQHIFMNNDKDLTDLEYGLSSDALLISYMLYDNINNALPDDKMINVRKYYCQLSEIEDFAFKTNEWTIVDWYTLVEAGMIRHMQNENRNTNSSEGRYANDFKTEDILFTQIPCRSSQRYCTMRKKASMEFFSNISSKTMQIMGDVTTKKTKNKTDNIDMDHIINAYTSNLTITKPRAKRNVNAKTNLEE